MDVIINESVIGVHRISLHNNERTGDTEREREREREREAAYVQHRHRIRVNKIDDMIIDNRPTDRRSFVILKHAVYSTYVATVLRDNEYKD